MEISVRLKDAIILKNDQEEVIWAQIKRIANVLSNPLISTSQEKNLRKRIFDEIEFLINYSRFVFENKEDQDMVVGHIEHEGLHRTLSIPAYNIPKINGAQERIVMEFLEQARKCQ